MNRKITQANWECKYRKARAILRNESELGNLSSRASLRRFGEIERLLRNVTDVLKKDPSDFLKREFLRQLSVERKLLIDQVLKRGWPRQFLKDTFDQRKQERKNKQSEK